MTEEKFEFVKELPPVKPKRSHQKYEDASRSRPGEWLKLPWADDRPGSLASQYRKSHNCETRTIERQVYIRALPEK